MKFQCIPNETIRMDDKLLGKADENGVLEVSEQTVLDRFLLRMKRAQKYLIEEPVIELTEEKIIEAAITEEPIKSTGPTAEKLGVKKPRAKK